MSLSTPSQITVPFANSGTKNDIPASADNSTGLAGYDLGFPPITTVAKLAGGLPPRGADFNGIFYDVTEAIRYLEAGGQFPYNSAFSSAVGGYPLGALVMRSDGSGLWKNLVENNTTDPEGSSASGWAPLNSGITNVTMTSANYTLTNLQAANDIIVISGSLTANLNLIFPSFTKSWQVINNCTGAFTVTCKTASGTGVATLSQGYQTAYSIYGDGTNIVQAKAVATVGITGAVRNLKCSVTTASASATFTADEIIVSTALGGLNYQLSNLSQTINLATTGAGGMDTGTAPASGFVAIYVIYNPTTGAAALLSSNATSAAAAEIYSGGNMPSGYTASALISVWPTTPGSLLIAGYQDDRSFGFASTVVLTTTTQQSSFTLASISAAVPRNAKKISGGFLVTSTSAAICAFAISPTSTGINPSSAQVNGVTGFSGGFDKIPVITPQSTYYRATVSTGTMSFTLYIMSYDI